MEASAVLRERSERMKRSRFSEEQIVSAIRQAESRTPIGDLCRKLGVGETAVYTWKKKYAHLSVSELRQVRRRKPRALHREPAPIPTGPIERWSMDVVHATLADKRPFRILAVVDNWSRSSPVLEAGFRMSGELVGLVFWEDVKHSSTSRPMV